MMASILIGFALGFAFVATVKGIQHNNKMVKETAKLHEQNMKQVIN